MIEAVPNKKYINSIARLLDTLELISNDGITNCPKAYIDKKQVSIIPNAVADNPSSFCIEVLTIENAFLKLLCRLLLTSFHILMHIRYM